MTIKSKRLRDSARDQKCTFQIPGICNRDTATTVLAHLQFEGGIMGSKAPDISAAFACSGCHEAIDQRKLPDSERWYFMARALVRTYRKWIEMGLVRFT